MLWEDEPLASVAVLAERGIDSVVFAPRAGRGDAGDTLTAMAAGGRLRAWVNDE